MGAFSNEKPILYVIKYYILKTLHSKTMGLKDSEIKDFLKALMSEIQSLKGLMASLKSSEKYERINKTLYLYIQLADDQYYKNLFSIELVQR